MWGHFKVARGYGTLLGSLGYHNFFINKYYVNLSWITFYEFLKSNFSITLITLSNLQIHMQYVTCDLWCMTIQSWFFWRILSPQFLNVVDTHTWVSAKLLELQMQTAKFILLTLFSFLLASFSPFEVHFWCFSAISCKIVLKNVDIAKTTTFRMSVCPY